MRLCTVIVACVVAGCGFDVSSSSDDAGPGGDGDPVGACGNGVVEAGEDCDNDLDVTCDPTCHFACGNGVVDSASSEACDINITSGAGTCPTSCDDGDACTSDTLAGTACARTCVFSSITTPSDGDGCCPAGANANTDSDCSAECGNAILEAGEQCDPGILMGAGACPTACDDGQACTTDALISAGSCQARCVATPITTNTPSDGCCRSGATPAQDNDCVGCGDGVVTAGETCDTAIANGNGACPTACSDADVCTSNTLVNMGTCQAACAFPVITGPANGDGCCPVGANANNDDDCTPVCRNGVVEAGEECDDGDQNNNNACGNNCRINILPTAFRFSRLSLVDPHAFTSFFACLDITAQLNGAIATSMNTDGADADSFLDLSPLLLFNPLAQTSPTSPVDVHFANCNPPAASTSCAPGPDAPLMLSATNSATSTCLAPVPNTLGPYVSGPNVPTAPCFSSGSSTIDIDLSGVPVRLYSARIAATYAGAPASQLVNGLLMGFLREADADMTILPSRFPLVGGQPFSSILAGGTGNCALSSDKDTFDGRTGWWMYMNFTAPTVPWTP